MDVKIWENTIMAWVNSLNIFTPSKDIIQIDDVVLIGIIKKFESNFKKSSVEFLKENFANLSSSDFTISSNIDFLCAATFLLIYISFSKRSESEGLRELMCTELDNKTQVNIAEFLMRVQNLEDPFSLSFSSIKQEIFYFIESHTSQISGIGDCSKTPVKINISNDNDSFNSPLQGFFQTPKKEQMRRLSKCTYGKCGDGDHSNCIKKLRQQLHEEELEKASLQEKLNIHSQRCSEYEIKLRKKIEEIKHLKNDWEIDSKKNEDEITLLKSNIVTKLEDEKKLKSELSHLENFISTLQLDFTNIQCEKDNLEYQLKVSLEKSSLFESQLKELTELNTHLQEIIDIKEKEIAELRENYVNEYNDDKSIDISCLDKSVDSSFNTPENMGVVIDKLLKESTAENMSLKETIEKLQNEKDCLLNKIKLMNEQLNLNMSTITELQFRNKELNSKIESFEFSGEELCKIQKELVKAETEVNRLIQENSQLNENNVALSSSLEKALLDSKNSKINLHINFYKLAKDFIIVQQNLEKEFKNILRLTLEAEPFSKTEVLETSEYKNLRNLDALQNKFKVLMSKEENAFLESFISDTDDEEKSEILNYLGGYKWTESKTVIQKTCHQIYDSILTLKYKIKELENKQKEYLKEKTKVEKYLKEADEKASQIQSSYSTEIQNLQEKLENKEKKVTELESIIRILKESAENSLPEKETQLNKGSRLLKEIKLNYNHQKDHFSSKIELYSELNETKEAFQHSQEDPSDSLEEIPLCNKTFDVVNVEDKNINEKTFFIKKEDQNFNKKNRNGSSWVVSPPSKLLLKKSNDYCDKKHVQGESWIIPIAKPNKNSISFNKTSKNAVPKRETESYVTKSSSLSSIIEIDCSPPSKDDSKCMDVCLSVTNFNYVKKEKNCSDSINNRKIIVQKAKSFDDSSLINHDNFEKKKDLTENTFTENFEKKIRSFEKQCIDLTKECDRLKSALLDSEMKRKKDKDTFENNQDIIRQNVTSKYESQLEYLKSEMKQLYNRELAKHKAEQSKLNFELGEQNKAYKEHIDELRNQLWDLGEKLLQEQKLKRDLERNYSDLRKKCDSLLLKKKSDLNGLDDDLMLHHKESSVDEDSRLATLRQLRSANFPTIPTEDEEEIFDNRFLEDMKMGVCLVDRPEGRLTELQYRNSLCLPHLKSSYPAETQFHNPKLFKENDIKFGLLQFGQESHSLTDSDHSMTRSLLPDDKGKKKEQPSYKKPGPPTPSKRGGRQSIQGADFKLTPRNVLKELNDQSERNKSTPNPLKSFFISKAIKSELLGSNDENMAPVTPRKKLKIFRKPFGARD